MRGRVLLAALSLALALALRVRADADADADSDEGGRAVGGVPVSIEALPYLLSLHRKDKGHVCDASLVARQWLLTAAHCVFKRAQLGRPHNYFVVAGITDLTGCFDNLVACIKTKGAQIGQPKRFVVNPDYDASKGIGNDVAMIKLRRKLNIGKRVNIVSLPSNLLDFNALNNETICSVAWWRDETTPRVKRLLYAAQMPLLDVQECSRKLARDLEEAVHLCTYAPDVEGCSSDCGSPLVCDGIQVGVVSADRHQLYKMCAKGVPGVYVRVDTHVPWMQSVMAAAPPSSRACVSCTLCLLCAINFVFL